MIKFSSRIDEAVFRELKEFAKESHQSTSTYPTPRGFFDDIC